MRSLLLCGVSIGALLACSVQADEGPIGKRVDSKATEEYWTPERMKNAQPLPLPESSSGPADKEVPAVDDTSSKSVSKPGKEPVSGIKANFKNLLYPETADTAKSSETAPANFGTLGARFSSSKLYPAPAAYAAFPNITVGQLFFTIPGRGDFVCSGSTQRARLVVTAGHCVHPGDGNPNNFYTNFRYVPARFKNTAPFGIWTPAFVATTNTWINGGGGVPNAADYALLEINDQNFQGSVRKIGQVTGFLGFRTLNLNPNHVHIVGYPCNLDGCTEMHWVAAESFANGGNNTVIYGSDAGGGVSGGPYIKNFGLASISQNFGRDQQGNSNVGVVSYIFVNPNVLGNGASVFDQRFTALINTACGHRQGNC